LFCHSKSIVKRVLCMLGAIVSVFYHLYLSLLEALNHCFKMEVNSHAHPDSSDDLFF